MRQIGPIVDKQTVRRHLDRYEEEEYPDGSGPDLYRAMRDYPRTGPETDVRDSGGGISSS